MTGVEIDFVVSDSLVAFETYHRVFGVEAVEKTSCNRGLNEVVFTIFGSRFHMLDENPDYGLFAPPGKTGAALSGSTLWWMTSTRFIKRPKKRDSPRFSRFGN